MNYRVLVSAVKWVVGVIAFVAVSVEAAHYYVLGMQAWARAHGCSRGSVLELEFLRVQVLAVCLIAGALYASALTKAAAFGGAARIWRHLVSTYLSWLLGCVLTVRAGFLPLPDFQHYFEGSVYLFAAYSLSFGCFVLGLLSWVHLTFGGRLRSEKRDSGLVGQQS